jgi:hypothetical protein
MGCEIELRRGCKLKGRGIKMGACIKNMLGGDVLKFVAIFLSFFLS